jgi:hypothetical protein
VNEAEGQQPAVQSVVHELAKPAARTLAWGSVAAGLAALVAATVRNVREG